MDAIKLTLTATRVSIERIAGGKATAGADVHRDPARWTDRQFAVAGREVGIAKMELKEHVRGFLADVGKTVDGGGSLTERLIPLAGDAPACFRVRGERESAARSAPTFDAALSLPDPPTDPVIEWDDVGSCCALDVDFHGERSNPERAADLAKFALTLTPPPDHWWITRSDGLRCVYTPRQHFTAEDLAAVAALEIIRRFPEAAIELNKRTRFPPDGKPRGGVSGTQASVDALRRLAGEYTSGDAEFAEWLAARDMVPGQRYPHTACPANPGARAEHNAAPVVVHEDHVYCYICAADGICHGSRTPGYFPAGRLCGEYEQGLFGLLVEHLTHWEHARLVVSRMFDGRPEALCRALYRAALRRRHGDDPRVVRVFTAGINLVRHEGFWADVNGEPVGFRAAMPAQLAELPAAMVADTEGNVGTSARAVEWLLHTGDISRYGYPPVVPVFGSQVSARIPPEGSKIYTVVHAPDLRGDADRWRRPRYVARSARHPDPWSVIERAYPGVRRDVIRLLIAAKGCTEAGAGLPPMLFFAGPTGAGKSASVKLAAAICGDRAVDVTYSTDTERVRAGLLTAKRAATFVLFDEFLKGAARAGRDPVSAMELLLNFTPDSVSHMLYVGPVPMGRLPVCCWSDTTIPPGVLEHAQLGRRLCVVRLHSRMAWERTQTDAGVMQPDLLRTRGPREFIDAANAILSDVMDEFFRERAPIFREVARELGFPFMEECDVASERNESLRAFFGLLRKAPPSSYPRWKDVSWKHIDLNRDGDPLVQAWRVLCDPKPQTASRVIDETDLQSVLGLRVPARLEKRSNGANLVVRLASAQEQDGRTLYNEELYALELEPGQANPDGPGDTVSHQPPGGWFASLPASL
jgi:hypothetical protein